MPLLVCILLQVDLQWFWLVLYAAITVPFAPYVANPSRFFRWGWRMSASHAGTLRCLWIALDVAVAVCRGGLVDTRTDLRALLMLAASVSISWVFAKCVHAALYMSTRPGVSACREREPVLTLSCALLQVHSQRITTWWQLWHRWSCCIHGAQQCCVRAHLKSANCIHPSLHRRLTRC